MGGGSVTTLELITGDDHDPGLRAQLPQGAYQIEPAAFGQPHVEDRKVRPVLLRHGAPERRAVIDQQQLATGALRRRAPHDHVPSVVPTS